MASWWKAMRQGETLQFTFPAGLENFHAEMGEPAQSLTLPPMSPPDMAKMQTLAANAASISLGHLWNMNDHGTALCPPISPRWRSA